MIECSVAKRNGSKEEFDQGKIFTAIEGAFDDEVDDIIIQNIVDSVLDQVIDSERSIISTEEINDFAERSLMGLGFYDEARNFIIYREQNKNIRKMSVDNDTMSEYIFTSRYSRYLPRKQRRESWNEAVDRVRDMHIKRYPQIETSIIWAFEQVRRKLVLPSMRSMQFGGFPIESKNARMYNCCYTAIDRMDAFNETMYLLLCGCGVGFSVEFENINKLPELKKPSFDEIVHFTIEDSIEGWADSIRILMDSYVNGYTAEFIYRKIRKQGTKIKSGGKAPGHVPLRRAIEKIRIILDEVVSREDKRIKPIEAYDIIMHASDAVLSGGVRRSATICLFSPEDAEMMTAKTGDWRKDNPQRGRSNNSVKLVREETTKEQFTRIFDTQKEFGEPGFYFVNNKDTGTNPCFHRDTKILTNRGWETIGDLYETENNNTIIVDNRINKDGPFTNNYGLSLMEATQVIKTGENVDLYKVVTDNGNEIIATSNHKFITDDGRKRLDELEIGDKLPVMSNKGSFGNMGTYEEGLMLGVLIGDGTITNKNGNGNAYIDYWYKTSDGCVEQYILDIIEQTVNDVIGDFTERDSVKNITWNNQVAIDGYTKLRIGGTRLFKYLKSLGIDDKHNIPTMIWRGTEDCVRGFIQGLMLADGSVQFKGDVERGKKATLSIRLTHSNEEFLKNVQILLNNFGVVSKLYSRRDAGEYMLPDGNGGLKEYVCKEVFELIINRPNSIIVESEQLLIGIKSDKLTECLNIRGRDCRKPERYVTEIVTIDYYDNDDVFCLHEPITNSVIANGIAVGQCVEIGLNPYLPEGYTMPDGEILDQKTTGFQFCVAGDTKLIHKDGIVDIKDAVGKSIDIWNGEQWSTVSPYKTGDSDKLYRLSFSDGSYLDATANHKFLVKQNHQKSYREIETVDILKHYKKDGFNTRKKLAVPRGDITDFDTNGVSESNAYDYGFFLGDGCIDHNQMVAYLYNEDKGLKFVSENKKDKIYYNYNNKPFEKIEFDNLDYTLATAMKNDDGLPSEVFGWNRESILSFIGGWLDADGSNASNGVRLYGRRDKLSDAQLLLRKVGINSSLNLMEKAGTETNLGVRKNDVWYLQITKTIDIPSQRLKCDNIEDCKFKGKYQYIDSIVELDGYHESFCLTEEKLHQCVFNNVLTKQCNLTTINGSMLKSSKDFENAVKAATIIGTCQAGYTTFPYLSKYSEEICRRESLLGVSITGIMDSPDISLNPELQREMAKLAIKMNKRISSHIGIPQAARVTCIKPEGTSSILLNTASGIHPRFSHRYFRRIQANVNDPVYQHFKQQNPQCCEPSVWSVNGTDDVITFCVTAPENAITKEDLSAIEFLEIVKSTQQNWVMTGTARPDSTPDLTHNVSNTVTVKPHEWDEVRDFIFENREFFTGISLLPDMGDKMYEQAPHQRISYDDEAKWTNYLESYEKVDYTKLNENDDETDHKNIVACSGGKCDISLEV